MSHILHRKQTLLIPSGTFSDPNKKHLFVILTDQCNNAKHLLVPTCSIKEGKYYDATCIIKAGDHPFIRHTSYIDYRLITERFSQQLSQSIQSGNLFLKEPCAESIFQKICFGINLSQHTPKWAKKQFNEWPS